MLNSNIYQINNLLWDSSFFNMKIGAINIDSQDTIKLSSSINEARNQNYRLLYIYAPDNVNLSEIWLSKNGGLLADEKLVYSYQSNKIVEEPSINIEIYKGIANAHYLADLALVSGTHSRFKRDNNFPEGSFERLYNTWISNSLTGQISDCVYVINSNDRAAAMVTVSWLEDTAIIGLIAVSPLFQGKHLGSALIDKIKYECNARQINTIQVSTQNCNYSARSFYEKNGFKILSKTNIYHFWL